MRKEDQLKKLEKARELISETSMMKNTDVRTFKRLRKIILKIDEEIFTLKK